MIIDFENLEDEIYKEIKMEMEVCGKFDRETCSKLTKEIIILANNSRKLLEILKQIVENSEPNNFHPYLSIEEAKFIISKAEGKTL